MAKRFCASRARTRARARAMDRISGLPHGILHHIISFLPKKDAFRMSVLSSSWKHVLHTYPYLDFSSLDFGESQADLISPLQQPGTLTKQTHPKLWEILDKFVNYVDHSMLRFSNYEFTLQRFALFIQLPDLNLASLLDKWVLLALEKGVKELHLYVRKPGFYIPGAAYVLPTPVFASTSLTVLRLYGCHLKESFCLKWYSLKVLELVDACIHEHLVRELVTCCPLIENLHFIECHGLKNVKIFGLPRLKIFDISSIQFVPESVEIASPSLEFAFFSFGLEEGVCTVKLGTCQALKTLIICGCLITEQLLQHFDSKFPILKILALRGCLTSERVKISSRSLEGLAIGCDTIVDLEIDTPKLYCCKYYSSVVPASLIKAPACKWQIDFVMKNRIDIPLYMKLKEFVAKLNQLKYLHIYIQATEILFNAEDLSTNASPSTIQDLTLTLDSQYPISNYAVFLDGLFWCYRPKNLFIVSASNCDIYVKYLSESLKRVDLSCCNHGTVRCWKHDLKEVNIKSFGEDAEGKFPHNINILLEFPKERSHACCKMEWR